MLAGYISDTIPWTDADRADWDNLMLDMRSLSGHRWTYLGLFALRFVWFRLGTPPKEFFQPDPNPSQFPLDSQPLLSSPPSRSPSKGRNGPRAAHDMRAPCCPISRLHRDLPEDRFTEQMVSNRSAGGVACRHGPSRRPRSEDGSEVSTVDGPVEDLYWPGHLEGGKSEPLARFLYKGPVDLGVSRERERDPSKSQNDPEWFGKHWSSQWLEGSKGANGIHIPIPL